MVDLEMEKALKICRSQKHEDLGREPGESWWDHRYDFFFPNHMFRLPQAFGTLDTVATFANIENVYWAMKRVRRRTVSHGPLHRPFLALV